MNEPSQDALSAGGMASPVLRGGHVSVSRSGRFRAVVAGGVLVMAVASVLLGGGWVGVAHPSGVILAHAMSGKVFWVAAITAAVSSLGLSLTIVMLWLAGRSQRRPAADGGASVRPRDPQPPQASTLEGDTGEKGTAALEFALLLPFMLMFFLLMFQASLMMGANLIVHYAAYTAARTAIVQIPLDLSNGGTNSSQEIHNCVVGDINSSQKLGRIRLAAWWTLMPIASSSTAQNSPPADISQIQNGLTAFFTSYQKDPTTLAPWITKVLPRRWQYVQDPRYTEVTLYPPTHGPKYRPYARDDATRYEGELQLTADDYQIEDITVNVRHTLHLSVPYASRVLSALIGQVDLSDSLGQGQYGINIDANCTLPNEGLQDYIDQEVFD